MRRLRRCFSTLFWRLQLYECGTGTRIDPDCEMTSPHAIALGERVRIVEHVRLYANDGGCITIASDVVLNYDTVVDASNGGHIEIGTQTIIGPRVYIRASNHVFEDTKRPIREQGHEPGKVRIHANVWIGAN